MRSSIEGSGTAGFLAQIPAPAKPAAPDEAGEGSVFEARFPRTLDELVERLAREAPGSEAEAWLFEDEAPRRAAEARLAEAGIRARFRSAYKPLVHAFLEEIAGDGLRRVAVAYPVAPGAEPLRFRLEAYPLAALVGGARLAFRPGGAGLTYRVALVYGGGRVVRHAVFAPNRLRDDPAGEPALSPCGWLRLRRAGGGGFDGPLDTEFEAVFDAVLAALRTGPVGAGRPPGERLTLEVAIPGLARGLAAAGERLDLAEALHEDLYFSAHEVLARRAWRPIGDRAFQPGQVVPVTASGGGEARVRVRLAPHGPGEEAPGWTGPLDAAEAPPGLDRIAAELHALGGEHFEARSVQGRPVPGTLLPGPGPALLVTAAQHGNETSGVVGALRAARRLAGRAHLALIPVENPDGYALHRWLCRRQPHHIHHAARLTALGDDLEARDPVARSAAPLFEAEARAQALRRTGAGLHLNLHGYPAHEWTRPLTGYVPRGFAAWTIPKGFFLILRHHPGWEGLADLLAEAVAARLAAMPGLTAFNEAQLARAAAHGSPAPGPLRHGIPCLVVADPRPAAPLTLVTEFPDETITGPPFAFAHEAQMRAVLAAAEAWHALAAA